MPSGKKPPGKKPSAKKPSANKPSGKKKNKRLNQLQKDLGKRLLDAAKQGNLEEVRALLSNGAPFISDWLGTLSLHFAAMNGHVATAEVLLEAGACIDARTKLDRTPLIVAAQEGYANIVDLLLRKGAFIEARDRLKFTALLWAVEKGHITVIQLLVASGAAVDVENKFGKTCIDIAKKDRQDILDILYSSIGIGTQTSLQYNDAEMTQRAVDGILGYVIEVNEVQPEITVKQEVDENITSAGAVQEDTYMVIDSNATGDHSSRGYYFTDGSGVTDGEDVTGEEQSNAATLNAVATASHTATSSSSAEADALKSLESQGISIMVHDNTTLVSNTLNSGQQQLALTEDGKLQELKIMVLRKNEDGQVTKMQSVLEGNMLMVDGQMVEVSQERDEDGTIVITFQPDLSIGTIISIPEQYVILDDASGEPAYALKGIKIEDINSNELIIEQNEEEERKKKGKKKRRKERKEKKKKRKERKKERKEEETHEEGNMSKLQQEQLSLKPEPE